MQNVPSFFVYGEPDREVDIGFMHVETVMERKQVHFGHVAAHKHDRMAQVTFWTKGRGVYFIEDEKLDFAAPAASFIPSAVVHGFNIVTDETDAIVVSIADSALPPIAAIAMLSQQSPIFIQDQPTNRLWETLSGTMMRILQDYQAGIDGTLAALLASVLNDMALLANSKSQVGIARGLAQEFKQLVDRHFRQNWPLERYLAELATTRHLLGRACREVYGLSPKDLADRRRLLEAKRLLLFTVRTVESIGYEIGYKDPAYFSRSFRCETGMAPGEWRRVNSEKTTG